MTREAPYVLDGPCGVAAMSVTLGPSLLALSAHRVVHILLTHLMTHQLIEQEDRPTVQTFDAAHSDVPLVSSAVQGSLRRKYRYLRQS